MNGAKPGEYWVKIWNAEFGVLFPNKETALEQQRQNNEQGLTSLLYNHLGQRIG